MSLLVFEEMFNVVSPESFWVGSVPEVVVE